MSLRFTYNGNGNLTSDGSNSFTYDIENRLITKSGGTSISYDPKGRLNKGTASSGTTRFLYDGDELVAEYASNGSSILRRYVHGAAVDDPLVWYEGAGTTDPRYLHTDERGSIVAVTNGSGTTLAKNVYDDWGIPGGYATATTGDDNLGRFQYTGQIWLPEIGAYYYKARMYSPSLGRFMQTDPIGYEDGMNMYAYVGNDPMNMGDPSGTSMAWQISGLMDQSGLDGLEGNRASGSRIGTTGTTRTQMAKAGFVVGARGVFVKQGSQVGAGSGSLQETAKARRGGKKGGLRGERGQARSASGTANPFKKLRRDPKDPRKVQYKDPQTGKTKTRRGTPEELKYLNKKYGAPKTNVVQDVVRDSKVGAPIAVGLCLLAPVTCSLADRNANNNIEAKEFFGID